MINVLQQALNRRRLLQSGAALGGAAAFGGMFSQAGYAQEEPELPIDSSAMDVLIAGAQTARVRTQLS